MEESTRTNEERDDGDQERDEGGVLWSRVPDVRFRVDAFRGKGREGTGNGKRLLDEMNFDKQRSSRKRLSGSLGSLRRAVQRRRVNSNKKRGSSRKRLRA